MPPAKFQPPPEPIPDSSSGIVVSPFDLATVLPDIAPPPVPIPNQETTPPVALPANIPGYEMLKIIGSGGMGTVVEARQVSLNRKVAIKVLSPKLVDKPGLMERFEREVATLARLNHPNIVNIFDRGREGNLLYFIMEYVDGPVGDGPKDLRQVIDSGKLNCELTQRLILEVVHALKYCHSQGIVHRDVKPSNVMLDRHGHAMVTDFGIAAVTNDSSSSMHLTSAGMGMGTYGYMAPEQLRNAATIDHRADIYSVGVMLYEMLTGALPSGSYLPASQAMVGLSSDWDDVVARAMHPKPEGRFLDMQAFSDALEHLAVATPVAASVDTKLAPQVTRALANQITVAGKAGSDTASKKDIDDRPVDRNLALALQFRCPTCKRAMRADSRFAGKQMRCPGCKTVLVIPSVSSSSQISTGSRQFSPNSESLSLVIRKLSSKRIVIASAVALTIILLAIALGSLCIWLR
jgi:serine/threonine protein kinase